MKIALATMLHWSSKQSTTSFMARSLSQTTAGDLLMNQQCRDLSQFTSSVQTTLSFQAPSITASSTVLVPLTSVTSKWTHWSLTTRRSMVEQDFPPRQIKVILGHLSQLKNIIASFWRAYFMISAMESFPTFLTDRSWRNCFRTPQFPFRLSLTCLLKTTLRSTQSISS